MDEKEIVKQIIESTALEVYKDSAKPAVRVVGKSLSQCVSLFVTPLGRTAHILEKNINRYLDKLEGLKEEELISPDVRVLVPILEKIRYTEDETVANYYAEILATASKKETRGKILLSFIEILNRVTSDEIKILEFINSSKNCIIVDATTMTKEKRAEFSLPNSKIDIALGSAIPIIDVRIERNEVPGYHVVLNNFNLLAENVSLKFPENVDSYLDNLISLGLLHIPHGASFALKQIYKPLKDHKNVKRLKKEIGNEDKLSLSFNESRIDLTNLSLKLLSLCKKL